MEDRVRQADVIQHESPVDQTETMPETWLTGQWAYEYEIRNSAQGFSHGGDRHGVDGRIIFSLMLVWMHLSMEQISMKQHCLPQLASSGRV